MSATLLIVIPRADVGLDDLRRILEPALDVTGDAVSLTVQSPRRTRPAFVVAVHDLAAEGLDEDWPFAGIAPEDASVFSVDYVDPNLAVRVAHLLGDETRAVVDTNFGAVLPAAQLTEVHLPRDL